MNKKRYYLFVHLIGITFIIIGMAAFFIIFRPGMDASPDGLAMIFIQLGIVTAVFGAAFLSFNDEWILGIDKNILIDIYRR